MRFRWDEGKRQLVSAGRDIEFEQLRDLMDGPYLEDQRSDDPEQYRLIGFADDILTTFIVEYRDDAKGSYVWIVTAWRSTREERRNYEQQVY